MDQIEQETQEDDPAIEVTDLPSTGRERNVVAPLAAARTDFPSTEGETNGTVPLVGILSGGQVTRPASIWRSWPPSQREAFYSY